MTIDWRPIKDAPKDGTVVLMWGNGEASMRMWVPAWCTWVLASEAPNDLDFEVAALRRGSEVPSHFALINPPSDRGQE